MVMQTGQSPASFTPDWRQSKHESKRLAGITIRRCLSAHASWSRLMPSELRRSFTREILLPGGNRAHFHGFEVGALHALERVQLVVVPPCVRCAGDEPVDSVIGDDH